jgi:hypothetical protein
MISSNIVIINIIHISLEFARAWLAAYFLTIPAEILSELARIVNAGFTAREVGMEAPSEIYNPG